MKSCKSVALLLSAAALLACEADSDGVFTIDATGHLNGLVYIDRNANGELELIDAPARGVGVTLVTPGSQQVIAGATTDANGEYEFPNVPVGRYSLMVQTASLGDSLQFASIDSATITVAANDTATAIIAVGYQQIPIARLFTVTEGRRVIIEGVALNALSAFGDSTLHVADTSGVLRALRVVAPATIQAGDTVRLLGAVTVTQTSTTIADATAFRVAQAPLTRTPVLLSTAAAATANDLALAFDLVRIDSATIVSRQILPGNELQLNVDDGSGIATVVLDPSGQFGSQPNMVEGALLDATGLLVPTQDGTGWILKPRNAQDVNASIQRVTIAQARALPADRLVEIEALALNARSAFTDFSVHIVDNTGSLRAVQVPNVPLAQGDSVRFVARIAIIEGHTILTSVSPTVLLQNRALPAPMVLSTLDASAADGGTLDAALVHIDSASITDAGTVGGVFVVGINDGSGRLEVRPSPQINTSGLVVGASVRVTGLLVPISGSASWMLRPRVQSDIEIISP
ncbi:MAG TPA: carboxypeptidase-like regulatory domain-containing protein [Longimicrobiales bacterium]|nr:carboxypeptidase-like regulatory domain-containing protein [Longimicrobiales bacterium]